MDLQALAGKTQLRLDKPLDSSLRYVLIQEGNDLSTLHQGTLHKTWLGDSKTPSLELPPINSRYLAIRWVDRFGRQVHSQVLQLAKPSRP